MKKDFDKDVSNNERQKKILIFNIKYIIKERQRKWTK